MQKLVWFGVTLGVTQGHRQHNHSIRYNTFIVRLRANTASLIYRTVPQLKRYWKKLKTKKYQKQSENY